MSRFRCRRAAIAIFCIASLALRAPFAHAQEPPPATSGEVSTCRMQSRTPDPACNQPSTGTPVRIPEPGEDRDDAGDGGIGILEVLGIIGVAIAGALLAKSLTGEKDASLGDLEREGPRTPGEELLGQYEVQGLVYPYWPVVVEVAAEADATTFIQVVTADGKEGDVPPMVISDAGGRPWGDADVLRPVEVERTERGILAKFELPADLGRGGRDHFQSARLSVLSGRMEGDEFAYSPLDVLALGAGPTAVGSAAVEISRFAPVADARRAGYVVTFNAPRTFTDLRAELIRRERERGSTRREKIVSRDICRASDELDLCEGAPPRVPYPVAGEWPVESGSELRAGSTYHMELRAYTGRIRSGGWLVGQAPQVVAWP